VVAVNARPLAVRWIGRKGGFPMASNSRYVREGIVAGLIGAAIIAVWFLIYGAARGRPFRTPALLGAATFEGVRDPALVPTGAHLVVPYTVLHGVVFAMIGVLIA